MNHFTVYSVAAALLMLVQPCSSAGMLHFEFTADSDCVVQLTHRISVTEKLYPFLTKTQIIHTDFSEQYIYEVSVRLVGKTSSDGAVEQMHPIRLDNNDKWSETVLTSRGISLLVRYTFVCENGFFGDHCQHVARPPTVANPVSDVPAVKLATSKRQPVITNETIIYLLLSVIVLLDCVIIFLCCQRSSPNLFRNQPKVSSDHNTYESFASDLSLPAASRHAFTPINPPHFSFFTPPETPLYVV